MGEKIAFIGVGRMGSNMVARLIAAGYELTIYDPVASATTEVERYCVWPGQACAYMLGKLTILRLRDKAKTALGPKFDIHQFHDAILLCGAVPLTVLETVVDNYIKAKRV